MNSFNLLFGSSEIGRIASCIFMRNDQIVTQCSILTVCISSMQIKLKLYNIQTARLNVDLQSKPEDCNCPYRIIFVGTYRNLHSRILSYGKHIISDIFYLFNVFFLYFASWYLKYIEYQFDNHKGMTCVSIKQKCVNKEFNKKRNEMNTRLFHWHAYWSNKLRFIMYNIKVR